MVIDCHNTVEFDINTGQHYLLLRQNVTMISKVISQGHAASDGRSPS